MWASWLKPLLQTSSVLEPSRGPHSGEPQDTPSVAGRAPGISVVSCPRVHLRARKWVCLLAGLLVVCCLTVFVLKSVEGSVPMLCGAWHVHGVGLCSASQQCRPVSVRSAGLDVRVGRESRARAWGLPCVLPQPAPGVFTGRAASVLWLSPDSSQAAHSSSHVLVFWLPFTHKPLSQRPK